MNEMVVHCFSLFRGRQDFGLLKFLPLDITNAESVGRVLALVDKANGFVLKTHGTQSIQQSVFNCAIQTSNDWEGISEVQERIGHEGAPLSQT
jgi:hypothetical protein